jgi:hypothetical protein
MSPLIAFLNILAFVVAVLVLIPLVLFWYLTGRDE